MALVTITYDDEKFVLVPLEPSKKMLEAGNTAITDNHDSWNYESDQGCAIDSAAARDCWKTMIGHIQRK
jgi:hypothetical protein